MAKKVAYCGMLCALAMIFSYVEALIPINFGIPGIKLGLANLVVLFGLYRMAPQEILAVQIARILLLGFMFGNGASIIYSLAGGLLSFAVMLLLIRTKLFTPIGVSAAGGAAHNIGQIIVAMVVLRSGGLLYYLAVLMVSGVITGVVMGLLGERIMVTVKQGDVS